MPPVQPNDGLTPIFPANAGPSPTDNPPYNQGFAVGGPTDAQSTETGYPVTGAGKGRMFPPGGGTDTNPGDPR